jgi:AraC-like DNA-binding protein
MEEIRSEEKSTSTAIVHISAGAIVPFSATFIVPFSESLKQFSVALTPQELKKMSVRQLQTLCDRTNKISPKTIQDYRCNRVKKKLLQQKIISFYASLS